MIFGLKMRNILLIIFGSALFGFGLVFFNIENELAEGGITGVTLILYYLFGIDPAISNLVLNIPLFFIGWRLLGRNVFIYTIIGVIGLSFFLWLFMNHVPLDFDLQDDMTLAALYAGVFAGSGLGLIFRYGGTTGGSDILARLAYKYAGWSIGRTMFLIDALVICGSLIYLDYRKAMYTLVAVFVGARVIDFIQKGAYAGKAATIISPHYEQIAEKIAGELERGATVLQAKGSYTGEQRPVLYCVVSRSEIFRLQSVIKKIDPHAFVAIHDVHDVLGEGFTLDENKKPLDV